MSHLVAAKAVAAVPINILSANAALVAAHTSHEIRLQSWLKRARPSVHILTTGSRSGDDLARVRASAQLVADSGARCGSTFGAMLDRDLYAAVMAGDCQPFERLTRRITEDFIAQQVELVVVDAWQYYNAAHDIAHVIGRVATAQASRALGRTVSVLDYAVVSSELAPHQPASLLRHILTLTEQERAAKAETAARFPNIQLELAELVSLEGDEAFAVETFSEPPPLESLLQAPAQKPEYERYGEQRVKDGLYAEVLRWAHVERIVRHIASLR